MTGPGLDEIEQALILFGKKVDAALSGELSHEVVTGMDSESYFLAYWDDFAFAWDDSDTPAWWPVRFTIGSDSEVTLGQKDRRAWFISHIQACIRPKEPSWGDPLDHRIARIVLETYRDYKEFGVEALCIPAEWLIAAPKD